jgi:hypothetical protein
MSFVSSPCFEERGGGLHGLDTAVLLPLFVSMGTRALSGDELAKASVVCVTTATAVQQPAQAAISAASAASKKVTKAKKPKLIVAAPQEDVEAGNAKETAAPGVDEDENDDEHDDALSSWQPSPPHASVLQLQAALKRSLFVLQQAMAQLAAPSSSAASSSDAAVAAIGPSGATMAAPLQLLSHVVHHIFLFANTSAQHRLLINQLATAAASALPSSSSSSSHESASLALASSSSPSSSLSSFHADRGVERALVAQFVTAMLHMRQLLPSASKFLSQRLGALNKPSPATIALQMHEHASPQAEATSVVTADAPDLISSSPSAEQRSALLSALASEQESQAGRAARQEKQALEQCHTAVQRLQHWLKSVFMEGAKKD